MENHAKFFSQFIGSYKLPKPISKLSKKEKLARPIVDLDLSVRLYNHLKNAGLVTLGDVVDVPMHKLMCRRNFGKKCKFELEQIFAEYGLKQKGA